MRYYELIGLIDDTFTKYRKVERTPDSKWTPYSFYKDLDDVKADYSVYVGSKGLRAELAKLLHRCEKEQKFKFTDEHWNKIFFTLEIANNQDNGGEDWTDIMFRSKYDFIDTVKKCLKKQGIHIN